MIERQEKVSFQEKFLFEEEILAALKFLNSISENCGTKMVLKGGAVRDRLARFYHGINLTSKDYDFFVLDKINLVIENIVKNDGIVVERRRRKGTPAFKFLLLDLAPSIEFEIGVLLGGDAYGKNIDFEKIIENDARRTDFDVNAISLDLSSLSTSLEYKVYDPLRGEEAIKNRLVSAISPVSFYHNPENIFRGIKAADRLRANLSDQTLQAMGRFASRLEKVPRDFLWANLRPILESPNSKELWHLMQSLGVIKVIFSNQESITLAEAQAFVESQK